MIPDGSNNMYTSRYAQRIFTSRPLPAITHGVVLSAWWETNNRIVNNNNNYIDVFVTGSRAAFLIYLRTRRLLYMLRVNVA